MHANKPTIVPADIFCPIEDSKALKVAMKGIIPDKNAVIDLITSRSVAQRLSVIDTYHLLYQKDLLKKFRYELWGDLQELILALMTDPIEYQAKQLHMAISAFIIDDKTIIEILSVNDKQQLKDIQRYYKKHFNASIEEHILEKTCTLQNLYLNLLKENQDDNTTRVHAFQLAKSLITSKDRIVSISPATLLEVLGSKNKKLLSLVFDEYEKHTGHNIEHCIASDFCLTTKSILLDLISSLRNIHEFFADKLYNSMVGLGTDDKNLIRIIVSRSEIDLESIKEVFLRKYKQPLSSFVEDDTSGHYRKCLLSIIERKPQAECL